MPTSGGPQLNYGLEPPEPLPPTAHSAPSPAPPEHETDDAQPAPSHEPEDPHHDSTDHTHAPDHEHWWHRDKSSARGLPCSLGGMLPLLALVLGLLT